MTDLVAAAELADHPTAMDHSENQETPCRSCTS